MGSVTLPSTGVIYVDAQVVIYTVEQHVKFGPRLEAMWVLADAGRVQVVTSELTTMETAIIPLRQGNSAVVDRHARFVAKPSIRVAPIGRDVLRQAAQLRAKYAAIRTPDAIHVATCVAAGCDFFLTNDFQLRSISEISPLIVADLPDPNP